MEAARRAVAAHLRSAGHDSADLDARVLVGAACELDHAALIRQPDRPLGEAAKVLARFVQRRLADEPVSRIIGLREFWSLRFAIDAAVLDPRPETEGLVASVLDALGGRSAAPVTVLDLGTGSGAILCALLTELPNAYGVAIDRSPAACRTARRNLATLGLSDRSSVVAGFWNDSLHTRFDVVVSNRPYIPSDDIADLSPSVRDFDPGSALDGGTDGLEAYRAICPQLSGLLTPSGIVALECGWDQGEAVASMLRGAGLNGVTAYKDLAGRERVVVAVK